MRHVTRFDCDMPGCTNRLDVPSELLALDDQGGDFEYGMMEESQRVIESVGWYYFRYHGSNFICPAHGTREQVDRVFEWRYRR